MAAEFILIVDDNPFITGTFAEISQAAKAYGTRGLVRRTSPHDPKNVLGITSTAPSNTPDTFRAAETGNSDPVKKQLAVNYNFWLMGISSTERLNWSKVNAGKTTSERIAVWQSAFHSNNH